MAYNIERSDGSERFFIEDGQVDTGSLSVTLVGKNVINYGLYQNENFLHLLENFAKSTAPVSPSIGQLWYDTSTSTNHLKVYQGSAKWSNLPNFEFSQTIDPSDQNPYDFWYDTDVDRLYIKNGAGEYILVGGADLSVSSASRLDTARTINGVSFDGTANITLTSNTTNTLTRGSYLTGNNFNGSAATTWSVDVGDVQQPNASKVVARDSSGDIRFNVGHGVATSARYADLAEKYLADAEYEFGTVMIVGGVAEVCACSPGTKAIGVVSINPGYMMNSDLEGGTYVALKGRVPVKVVGDVNKGDYLIPGPNGCAIATQELQLNIFAVALTHSQDTGYVEAVIL
jgi:hypothetical protein